MFPIPSQKKRSAILATSVAALLSLGLLLSAPRAAADQYWDSSNPGTNVMNGSGGSGTWDNATPNWSSDGSGSAASDQAYDSAQLAIFSTTGGTVTLGDNITFNALRFDGAGYTINPDSGGTFQLTPSPTATITVNGASFTATINAPLTGGGFISVQGPGTLNLAGNSTSYTGQTTLNSGTLNVNNSTALGGFFGGTLLINGGTIGTTTAGGTTMPNPVQVDGNFSIATNVDAGNPGNQNLIFGGTVNLGGLTRIITGVTIGGQVQFQNVINNGGVTFTTNATVNADPTSPYVAFIYSDQGVAPFANWYTGTTTVTGHAILVLENSTPDAAIQGNVDVEGNGAVDYVGGANLPGQIADTSAVTVNSPGSTIDGSIHFDGFEMRGASETIGTLNGSTVGTIGLGSGTLTIAVGGSFAGVIEDGFFGTGGNLTMNGTGTLVLSGANTYTGVTTVTRGTLAVDGTIASSSGVSVASGAKLSGHGRVSKISGSGLVAPGDPQILTATQVDPSGGLDFAFSFAHPGSPIYGNASASGNDVLHLTGSTPFVFSLTAANAVTLDFSGATLSTGQIYLGGFFTDASIANSILNSADFVFTGLNGATVQYEGLVTEPSAAFATGTVTNGKVMEFQVMSAPEPSTWMMLAGGIGAFACFRRFGRRRKGDYAS